MSRSRTSKPNNGPPGSRHEVEDASEGPSSTPVVHTTQPEDNFSTQTPEATIVVIQHSPSLGLDVRARIPPRALRLIKVGAVGVGSVIVAYLIGGS